MDDDDHVLYVGKAKNLKNRVSSYRMYNQLSGRIKRLVTTARKLKFQVLDSELEALLVEAELIRTHQPPFNVALKDDKTPLYIIITKETFPRVLTARKKEVLLQTEHQGMYLGPFPSAYKVTEVLKIARTIFPWCNAPGQGKPCFYYHLQLCPGACIGKISAEDYQQNIKHLTAFLRGQKKSVVKNIENDMKAAADKEKFEQAALLRDSLNNIKIVTEGNYLLKPNVSLPSLKLNQAEESLIQLRQLLRNYINLPKNYPLPRIECYDVSNMQGTDAAVAMVTAIDGLADHSQYRLFNIKTIEGPNDYGMMKEALLRRQNHPAWGMPDLLVIDGGKGQLRAALSVWYWPTPIISIAKEPDRIIIPDHLIVEANVPGTEPISLLERMHNKVEYHELKLSETYLALQLIQRLRDEAHRFSKRQYHRRSLKHLLPD